MPSTSSLIHKLITNFPQFTFTPGGDFRWDPQEKAIFYRDDNPAALLHEVAHALLNHAAYVRDLELLAMERDAWEYAKSTLSPAYGITIVDDEIDRSLDTYRDWLHARSTCPTCQATGIQTKENAYTCLACHTHWRVNEARLCALRRYKVA